MSDQTTDRPMIRLVELTKTYPGRTAPAVDALSLDVPEGEIVVFVGPSGCGKTTTMKLINRLIEPTSGRILLDGEDVTHVDPDRLRRGIGYAIQQTGLFPHRTVAENIATVPKLLGWDRTRVAERVDALLHMVGLAPEEYRDLHPRQLSGGQQQRVGVARALAADPPVLLMDEPFGAIDPLTRETLQNELLRIQREIRKTIVFVTHDIDEAVKMGDRIAIFAEGGRVVQYDTPERILSEPADDFVSDFIGAGASVRRLSLTRIGDATVAEDWPTLPFSADASERAAAVAAGDHDFLLLLDDGLPVEWLPSSGGGGLPVLAPVGPDHTLYDALDTMLSNNSDVVVVTDAQGRYRGTLDLPTIQDLIHVDDAAGVPTRVSRSTSRRSGEPR
ncbi:ABC transporter ATP-binding protein [Nocardiopsis sp. MG754419]|uniref:ABC transporter ATP-binding protein n=1 Tax=Nocardiopsis sp. MG754419 TaxID=2259865 RepID=UPI001BABD08A|nr:ABC transporter ATP-binding protein [Nocardiopsis sp. MG754419]MBR8740538.1 ABC transporter [Nocardiopsis sp. MG754419]